MISQKGILLSQFDYDALLFLNSAGITDPTQRLAVNYLTFSLKVNGLWDKLNAIYPMVGGTALTHKFNLKNPANTDAAFRLSFFGGWIHSQLGALPDGTNAYAETFCLHTQLNSSSISFYSRTNSTGLFNDIGNATNTTPNSIIIARYLDRFYGHINQSVDVSVANTDSTGFYIVSRTASNIIRLFKNDSLVLNSAAVSTSIPTNTITISAWRQSSVSISRYSNRQCSFATIGSGLTDTESLALYNVVQAFQTILGRSIGTQSVSDTDAQAFINASGIVDQSQANAINTLVTDLKTNGLWTKMNVIYPFVGGSATSHKFNLKDPRDLDAAFRLSFVGGWVHSSTGALPNGVNTYANTFFNTNTSATQNSHHLSYYSRINSNGTEVEIGNQILPSQNLIEIRTANTTYFVINQTSPYATFTDTDSRGYYIANRTASNVVNGWKSGIKVANATTATNGRPNNNIYLGAANNNGTAAYFTFKQSTFATIGSGLTDTESLALYNVVQAFQTILGRSIGTQTVSDPDAQAFINSAVIIDQVQANAINTLVTDLKTNGLWTKMKAIYPFVGGTATTNKFNLKDPRDLDAAFRLSFVGGWVHSDNGSTPNGTNAYANTFYNCSTESTVSNACFGAYSRTNSITGVQVYGAFTATNTVRMFHNLSSGGIFINANPGGMGYTPNPSTGFFLARRESSILSQAYKNGLSVGTSTVSTTNLPNFNFYFGATNDGGNLNYYTTHQLAFGVLGGNATITDADSLTLYNIVQTFQTNLSRQI